MGRVKRKSPYPLSKKKARKAREEVHLPAAVTGVEPTSISPLAIDIWRIAQRAKKEAASERISAACERAQDRLQTLGFVVVDLTGHKFDPDSKLTVIEHQGGSNNIVVVECISPAIYYRDALLTLGEVITKGE